MGFTREDKESRKFLEDPSDSSKFLVRTTVENADGDPIPVKIVIDDTDEPSTQTVDGAVEINNAEGNPVNVKIVTDATDEPSTQTVDGTVVVSSITATTDVNITNDPLNVDVVMPVTSYNAVHDGATWRNELADSSGRTITKQKMYYSAADITALASSTSVQDWMAAKADGVLVKNYNSRFHTDNTPVMSFYTFPTLGDGNKCLKVIYSYTGSQLVSVTASVDDWSYDSLLAPAATLSNGLVTPPANDAAAYTQVCTLSPGGGGGGATYTIVVSGTDSDKYRICNETTTTYGTSVTAVPGDAVVLQTSVTFNFGSTGYSHAVTVTSTEDVASTSASVNITTTQGADASYQNDKYWAWPSDGGSYTMPWASGTSAGAWADWNTHGAPTMEDDWAAQFWFKTDNSDSTYLQQDFYLWSILNNNWDPRIYIYFTSYEYAGFGTQTRIYPKVNIQNASNSVNVIYQNTDENMVNHNTWNHFVVNKKATPDTTVASTADVDLWLNGTQLTTAMTGSGTYGVKSYTNLANAYARCMHPYPKGQWGIDEVAFWDRALTNTEITNAYNSGDTADLSSVAPSGLRGWYRFGDGDSVGDGSGTADDYNTCHDMSGDANGKDLELTYGGSETDMIKDH